MTKLDYKSLSQQILCGFKSIVTQWIPGGRMVGDEYIVCNPTRSDKTAGSFKIRVSTGAWGDFAGGPTDRGGDPISLYAYINRLSQHDAAVKLSEQYGSNQPMPVSRPAKPDDTWQIVAPVATDAPKPPTEFKTKINDKWVKYPATQYYEFHAPDGRLLGFDIRFETPEGKQVLPCTLWRNTAGQVKWKFKHFPDPRPLYNLDRISRNPTAKIIVVEGAKCAKVFQALIDENNRGAKFICTTWIGGCNSVLKADWKPLQGREILFWPDSDLKHYPDAHPNAGELMLIHEQPGYAAMATASQQVSGALNIVTPPYTDKPDGWDVADAILNDHMSLPDIFDFVKDRLVSISAPELPAPEPEPSIPPDNHAADNTHDNAPEGDDDWPFQFLGYNRNFCFYLPNGKRMVKSIKDEAHNQGTLLGLAPMQFWEHSFHSKSGPNWKLAANALLRLSEKKGVYDPNRQRGRGGWFDHGRSVLNLGDRLVIDGQDTPIQKFQTRFIYEAGPVLDYSGVKPLPNIESAKLQKIIDSLFWEKTIHGKLLAGWCMVATICGAMKYRPHVWITAKPGSGKSWILDKIVSPVLGKFALSVQANTSEAGIRQYLGTDALPVKIDEFEGNDFEAQRNLQKILDLARQAFSDSDARIIKGGQGGTPGAYQIRSTFLMSSVNINLPNYADETRISALTLEAPFDRDGKTKDQHFDDLEALVEETITEEWCAALRARAVQMIPIIRANASTFGKAVARYIGKRRSGDQLGTLLAGAYALVSSKAILDDDARQWVSLQDWADQREVADKSDEQDCFNHILQHIIKPLPAEELSVAEAIHRIYQDKSDPLANPARYDDSLKRIGIRYEYDEGMVYIATPHVQMKRGPLKGTAWINSYGRVLARLPGVKTVGTMRFNGIRTRAVGIPWSDKDFN
jgi:putative DNA primase/helicase